MSPLYADRVARELNELRDQFKENQEQISQSTRNLLLNIDRLAAQGLDEVAQALAQIEAASDGPVRFGARPTREQDHGGSVLPFAAGRDWSHHQDSRQWAMGVLQGVTTYAVDGSVIEPNESMSVSVGLVQVGWFENPHVPDQPYVKNVDVQIVLPHSEGADGGAATGQPITDDSADELGVTAVSDIALQRYLNEFDQAIRFMKKHKGAPAVVFMDGTLTISFVRAMDERRQQVYRDKVTELMRVSEATGIPAVGYVDASRSVDLVTLLISLASGQKPNIRTVRGRYVTDAGLLRAMYPPERTPMQWGDRSVTYICDRDDGVIGNAYYADICFTYLKTTGTHPPARLEIPRWVFEDAELYEWVLDVVRAECVVGVGYPYPLETADAVAVLSAPDREKFYRLFQGFAEEQGMSVHFSRKLISKRARRI